MRKKVATQEQSQTAAILKSRQEEMQIQCEIKVAIDMFEEVLANGAANGGQAANGSQAADVGASQSLASTCTVKAKVEDDDDKAD